MAFGFDREKGSARGYINRDNPLFAPGQRLSRRQYDAYVAGLGQRRTLPTPPQAAQSTADIEGRLEGLRRRLEGARSASTRRRVSREIAATEAAREAARATEHRLERQGAGQRRYNLMLDLYVRQQRELGRDVTKRQAAQDPAFKEAVRLAKGRRVPVDRATGRRNPNAVARNAEDRRRGFAAVGGADRFREEYDAKYGRRTARGSRRGGGGNRRNAARGRA